MRRILVLTFWGIGSGIAATAAITLPEVDPASAGSALALLAGVVLVFQGRRRK
jgi:MYXO-CTERM domain-containing protein